MVKEAVFEHGMFTDSILKTSRAQRSRRNWTALTSFGLQAVMIGILLLIPLLTSVVLPAARTVSTPISMGRRSAGSAPAVRASPGMVQIIPQPARLMMPSRIPRTIEVDAGPAPQIAMDGGADRSSDLGPPVGNPNAFPMPIPGTHPVTPVTPVQTSHPLRISSMLPGSLIRKVQPVYPVLAKSAHIQGTVVLEAVISKAGTIENLQLVSGHPMLVPAAIEAVRQWRYKPYILNGDAIEVETQITVNFTLASN